jgi:hypothetical protein
MKTKTAKTAKPAKTITTLRAEYQIAVEAFFAAAKAHGAADCFKIDPLAKERAAMRAAAQACNAAETAMARKLSLR